MILTIVLALLAGFVGDPKTPGRVRWLWERCHTSPRPRALKAAGRLRNAPKGSAGVPPKPWVYDLAWASAQREDPRKQAVNPRTVRPPASPSAVSGSTSAAMWANVEAAERAALKAQAGPSDGTVAMDKMRDAALRATGFIGE